MVLFNHATREMTAKIVYYGPGLCGKTTNLMVIFDKLDPKQKGKMLSLATKTDRTLFFDLLPVFFSTSNGFKVKVNETGNNAARARLGVDKKYGSCHTGLVGGYALEGHVPASEIKRVLRDKPAAIGLAVPGMPVGVPGMDGAVYGGRKDAFDVLLLAKDGSTKVYQHYEGNKR